MPGKVNPTQVEALTQVCAQVLGNDTTITFAGTQGQLQLNVYRPLVAYNFLQSVRILADGCDSLRNHLLVGLEPRLENIREGLENSLMLVTALAPQLGYDKASDIAKNAHEKGLTLREAAVASGAVSAKAFDHIVDPTKMLGPDR